MSGRWIFQKLYDGDATSWIIVADEYRRLSASEALMSRLFDLSDVMRRGKGRMGQSGLFLISESEVREWYFDCYGISYDLSAPILSLEVLERVLIWAENPDMFTEWHRCGEIVTNTSVIWKFKEFTAMVDILDTCCRVRNEAILFVRQSNYITEMERAQAMQTLNGLRTRLIDASSGGPQLDSELRRIRCQIYSVAQVKTSCNPIILEEE